MGTVQVGPYLIDSITGKRLNNPTPSRITDPKLAEYTRQQYLKYAGTGLSSGGGKLRSTGMGITPTAIIPRVSTAPKPITAPAKAPTTSSGGGLWGKVTGMVNRLGNQPAGLPTPQAAAPVDTGPDWLGLLNKLMKPQGPDYQALIRGLGTPGKIADLATPDFYPIYDKMDDPINAAYQALTGKIEGLRAGAVGREQAQAAQLAQDWATTKGGIQSSFDKGTAEMEEGLKRLGIEDTLSRGSVVDRKTTADRLAGLADIANTAFKSSSEQINTAAQGNYDTMASMAAGGNARALAELATVVANGQSQAKIQTQEYQAQAKLAEAQGRYDLAQIYANNALQQQQNQMSLLEMWSKVKSDYESSQGGGSELTANQESVQKNTGLWEMIQGLPSGASRDYLQNTYSRNSDPDAVYNLLSEEMQRGNIPTLQKSNLPSWFPGVSLINNLSGKLQGMQGQNPDRDAITRALEYLRPYTSSYGGRQTTTKLSSKGSTK